MYTTWIWARKISAKIFVMLLQHLGSCSNNTCMNQCSITHCTLLISVTFWVYSTPCIYLHLSKNNKWSRAVLDMKFSKGIMNKILLSIRTECWTVKEKAKVQNKSNHCWYSIMSQALSNFLLKICEDTRIMFFLHNGQFIFISSSVMQQRKQNLLQRQLCNIPTYDFFSSYSFMQMVQ